MMKLELRGEPLPKEPVAKLYLKHDREDEFSLCYEDEDGNSESLAFFLLTQNTFHVFKGSLANIGYRLIIG